MRETGTLNDAEALPLLATDIPSVPRFRTGKVRDVYDLGDALLLVATDRISAFDVVMPNGIPGKGRILTQMSRFWFQRLRPLVSTHYITCDMQVISDRLNHAGASPSESLLRMLAGRSMLAVKAETFPIECVVRGYLAGSLWREYRDAGGSDRPVTLHGLALPAGLRECDRLPSPLFTPAIKAETGHDQNISLSEMARRIGDEPARRLADVSVGLYTAAATCARQTGLLLADTKFEFGLHAGAITLIDEVLTPDSSRFWEESAYAPGGPQPAYDKQFVRDWLEAAGWNKMPPAPELPPHIVARTADRYAEAYRRLAGAYLPGL